MKIIEKKCPNCGAGLEFDENARACRCEYCKRSFVIERDETIKTNNISERYKLNASSKKLVTIILLSMFTPMFLPFIIYIMIFIAIIFSSVFAIPNAIHEQLSTPTTENVDDLDEKEEEKKITSIDDLDDKTISRIKNNAEFIANQTAKGQHNLTYSFTKCDSLIVEKTYFAYKDDSNSFIVILRTKYHNFWDQSVVHTVYIPVVYNNVNNDSYLLNGNNPAPEYYFNDEKTTYVYAYATLEDAYNGVIKPLESDYVISQK